MVVSPHSPKSVSLSSSRTLHHVYAVLRVKANRSSPACGIHNLRRYLLHLFLKSHRFSHPVGNNKPAQSPGGAVLTPLEDDCCCGGTNRPKTSGCSVDDEKKKKTFRAAIWLDGTLLMPWTCQTYVNTSFSFLFKIHSNVFSPCVSPSFVRR